MSLFFLILFLSAVLAAPAILEQSGFSGFARALLVSCFGVIIPIGVFLLSAFMVPEWKGGCRFGWVDCFHTGKLALTPFVLWATAALYAVELLPAASKGKRWVALGTFIGALVAGTCFGFGVMVVRQLGKGIWLAVPGYIAVWLLIRAVQLVRQSEERRIIPYLLTVVSSIPFWYASAVWSRKVYAALPEDPPSGCFVVTAASFGHPQFVGPFVTVIRGDRTLVANRQLLRMWQFEELWRREASRSHAVVRKIYNRLGPKLARLIRTPLLADLAYLSLKPIEWVSQLILFLAAVHAAFAVQSNQRTHTAASLPMIRRNL